MGRAAPAGNADRRTPPGPSSSEITIRGHRVAVDRPAAKVGSDAGPMGGERLLGALGGCIVANTLRGAIALTVTSEVVAG